MAVRIQQGKFVFAPWHSFVGSVGGMTLTYAVTFHRELIPYGSLSFVGTFLHWVAYDHHTLITVIWWGAFAAHIIEGLYGWYLARRAGMTLSYQLKWAFQTTLVGFPSLNRLKSVIRKSKNI